MKKKILVMATISIEGENLTNNLIKILLNKIRKFFSYKYRYKDSNVEIVYFELSDNFVELE